jgi:hypothetical protein
MSGKRKSEREALAEAVEFLADLLAGDERGETLAERAGRAGFPPALLTRLANLFRRPDRPRLPSAAESLLLGPGEQARLGELLQAVEIFFLRQIGPRSGEEESPEEEIHALADELAACPPEEARILIAKGRDYGRWEICLRLCEQSEAAAAENPERAKELAHLALEVAGRVENEDPSWRGKLRALALAHGGTGNGNLPPWPP